MTEIRIKPQTVVHAKTEEEANKLCQALNQLGATWVSGQSYLNNTHWDDYKGETCYEVRLGMFSDRKHYRTQGYEIISVQEFLDLHKNDMDSFGNKLHDLAAQIRDIASKIDELSADYAELVKNKNNSQASVNKLNEIINLLKNTL